MKKFTNILESQENSNIMNDFKNVILDLFDDDLKITNFYMKKFPDANGVYIYSIQMCISININNRSFESCKKLFDIFYNNKLKFSYSDNVLTSTGLLSELANIIGDLQTEVQSKKYNL